MKWVLIIGGVVVVLAAVVVLVGMAVPKAHRASRTSRLSVPPGVVFAAITDVDKFPTWRTDVKSVKRLPDRDGRPVWVEDGSSGSITLAIERREPPHLLVTRIADPELPFGGTWTYEIQPAADGSVVTITEDGEIYNPVFRFMARYVFGYESTMAGYLEALGRRVQDRGASAPPR